MSLEACYNVLIVAENEDEAVNFSFSQDLPVVRIEDFTRDVTKVVQMNKRVYVS